MVAVVIHAGALCYSLEPAQRVAPGVCAVGLAVLQHDWRSVPGHGQRPGGCRFSSNVADGEASSCSFADSQRNGGRIFLIFVADPSKHAVTQTLNSPTRAALAL